MSVPPAKRARLDPLPSLPAFPQEQQILCRAILDAVLNETDQGREVAAGFRSLPDREQWPDYYSVIVEPVCLDDLEIGLESGHYASAQEFHGQLQLVFRNALYYNEEDSPIAHDAARLSNVATSLYLGASSTGRLPPLDPSQLPTSFPTVPMDPYDASLTSAYPPYEEPIEISEMTLPNSKKRVRTLTNAEVEAQAKAEAVRILEAASLSPAQGGSSAAAAALYAPFQQQDHSQQFLNFPGSSQSALLSLHSRSGSPLSSLALSHSLFASEGFAPETISDPANEVEAALQESEAIVQTLDASLPPMLPLADVGFLPALGTDGEEWREREKQILEALKCYEGEGLVRYGELLEQIPEATEGRGLSFDHPLSLKLIEAQVDAGVYQSALQFDKDLAKLFEKARRFYPEGEKSYGDILVLQRLYQLLTSPNPSDTTTNSATNFSSVLAGPGHARAMKAAEGDTAPLVTVARPSNKERQFIPEAWFKGQRYKIGDYVHLINPSDPSKPIIGHIFKVFTPTSGHRVGQSSITCCWYFRQEQTIHPPEKTFYENEVFKTGHFADHYVEDIIEHVGCQFYTKSIRGRPLTPFWAAGWPHYVVDCRYNDKEHQMVRIKNWASCIPEDLRGNKEKVTSSGSDFGLLVPFSETIKLRRVVSPFLRGIIGPGKLGPFGEKKLRQSGKGDGEDENEEDEGEGGEGGTPKGGKKTGGKKASSVTAGASTGAATPVGAGPSKLSLSSASVISPIISSAAERPPLPPQPAALQQPQVPQLQAQQPQLQQPQVQQLPVQQPPVQQPQVQQPQVQQPQVQQPQAQQSQAQQALLQKPQSQPQQQQQLQQQPQQPRQPPQQPPQQQDPIQQLAPPATPQPTPQPQISAAPASITPAPVLAPTPIAAVAPANTTLRPAVVAQPQPTIVSTPQHPQPLLARPPLPIGVAQHPHPTPQHSSVNATPSSSFRPGPGSAIAGGPTTPAGMMRPPPPVGIVGPSAPNTKNIRDRSVIAHSGGPAWVQQVGQMEYIPDETVARFDRDPTSTKLYWYSSPPLSLPPNPKPRHSPEYLAYLAEKLQQEGGSGADGDGGEGQEEDASKPTSSEHVVDPPQDDSVIAEAIEGWKAQLELEKQLREAGVEGLKGEELDRALEGLDALIGDASSMNVPSS